MPGLAGAVPCGHEVLIQVPRAAAQSPRGTRYDRIVPLQHTASLIKCSLIAQRILTVRLICTAKERRNRPLRHTPHFCKNVYMRTNIDLDTGLVARGLKLSGLRTKKDLVNVALQEFVRRKDQKKILELRGRIPWEGDLEAMRQSRF